MSRPLRIEFAGALYNVTSRGDGREEIYLGDEDRELFLDVLGEACEGFNWAVHAWCQMTNHYHLLVETPNGNLSKGMRHLNGVYTQWPMAFSSLPPGGCLSSKYFLVEMLLSRRRKREWLGRTFRKSQGFSGAPGLSHLRFLPKKRRIAMKPCFWRIVAEAIRLRRTGTISACTTRRSVGP